MEWDPAKYVEFGDYRNRPFFDLTSRVLAEAPRRVVDLGCGPGNLTATLAHRWPDAQVVGLDSSPQMIETARDYLARRTTFRSPWRTSRVGGRSRERMWWSPMPPCSGFPGTSS